MSVAPELRGPLPPGSTIGILGAGQLARMLVTAAARLGLRCHIYADAKGPACDVAAAMTIAPYDDMAWLEAFAADVDVVTFEFENVPETTALALAGRVPVRPNPRAFQIAQDRLIEKRFVAELGILVAPYVPVNSADAAVTALQQIAAPSILKTARLGYDGKGQIRLAPGDDVAQAWKALGGVPAVLEQRLAFKQELSVVLARGRGGATAIYDLPQNMHAGGILRRSVVPAPIDPDTAASARQLAIRIAHALDYIGVLAVELFDLGSDVAPAQRLVVNEIAPRVHNSGHWTLDACAVSQFENHMRAVADWPLGSAERHSDAEMLNLIGEEVGAWRDLAADPGACVHLYGKREAREGRKMGHVNRLLPKGARGVS
jgi:5-(carboxyamino)imidazole ribonucleotide synthase